MNKLIDNMNYIKINSEKWDNLVANDYKSLFIDTIFSVAEISVQTDLLKANHKKSLEKGNVIHVRKWRAR